MRFRGLIFKSSLVATGVSLLLGSAAYAKKQDEPWDVFNDPLLWMKNPVVKFSDLPKNGSTKTEVYSGHAWSQYRGGFAWRPNTPMNMPKTQDIDYELLTKEKVLKLSPKELSSLSPAEKLSLINCDYDFNLVKTEREQNKAYMDTAREIIKSKEKSKSKISLSEIPNGTLGFCHLVAELPIYFEEPSDATVPGCDGISVPVSSADLKAMAMMSLRKSFEYRKHDVLGRPCKNKSSTPTFCASCAEDAIKKSNVDEGSKKLLLEKIKKYYWTSKKEEKDYITTHDCDDTNPGSMHIMLANVVGKDRKTIIMDRDQDQTIWNRTIKGYSSSEIKTEKLFRKKPYPGAAEGTKVVVPMRTTLNFIANVDSYMSSPDKKQPIVHDKAVVEYYLELNDRDEIIGGRWITQNHPDLFWKPNDPDQDHSLLLSGEFEKLKDVLKLRKDQSK